MTGPYSVDWWGDLGKVLASNGREVAQCDDKNAADLVCAALNAAHHLAECQTAIAKAALIASQKGE